MPWVSALLFLGSVMGYGGVRLNRLWAVVWMSTNNFTECEMYLTRFDVMFSSDMKRKYSSNIHEIHVLFWYKIKTLYNYVSCLRTFRAHSYLSLKTLHTYTTISHYKPEEQWRRHPQEPREPAQLRNENEWHSNAIAPSITLSAGFLSSQVVKFNRNPGRRDCDGGRGAVRLR